MTTIWKSPLSSDEGRQLSDHEPIKHK